MPGVEISGAVHDGRLGISEAYLMNLPAAAVEHGCSRWPESPAH